MASLPPQPHSPFPGALTRRTSRRRKHELQAGALQLHVDLNSSFICWKDADGVCRPDIIGMVDWTLNIQLVPILCRIQYKVSSLCHCSLCEGGPRYLSELLHKYTPSRQLRSSSDSFTLRDLTTNRKNVGERSFSFTGPTVWNSLPFDIRSVTSTPSIK